MKENRKYLAIITGPTAVGKTDLSIELAKHFNTEIISADSRQFYRELKIGAAPPELEQLEKVKHHFIGNKSITDYYNVSLFEQDVLKTLDKLFTNNHVVILTGGSGLYIDAVCHGIDDMPDHDPELRKQLIDRMNSEGVESLRLELKKLDPESYKKVDLKNKNRVFRALEMCLQTGIPYSQFLSKQKRIRPFNMIRIAINRERAELHDRINSRVDLMIEKGLEQEAYSLIRFRNNNALNTVGYKELFDFYDGKITKENAIELIKRNTRRYARRQISWFNRNNDYTWFTPDQFSEIFNFIEKQC